MLRWNKVWNLQEIHIHKENKFPYVERRIFWLKPSEGNHFEYKMEAFSPKSEPSTSIAFSFL